MPLQMPARLLPAFEACFPPNFPGLNIKIYKVVAEIGPLKKMSSSQIADPYGPPVVSRKRDLTGRTSGIADLGFVPTLSGPVLDDYIIDFNVQTQEMKQKACFPRW